MTSLPPTWAEAALSELGTWSGGTTPQKANPAYWLDGSIPWVSPKDMKVEFINDAEDKLTVRAVEEGGAHTLPSGTLLLVTRSGILQHTVPVAVTEVEVAINQDIKALVPASGIEPEFLAAQLRWRTPELLAHAAKAGTTVDSLDFGRLKSFTVRIAPTGEQRRLSERLRVLRSGAARVRAELERVRSLAKRARETVADLASTGQLTHEWRDASDAPPPVEEEVGSVVAEAIRTGLSIRGRAEPPGVRALRLSALREPVVDLEDVRYLPLDPSQVERFELREGDVLISRGSGTKGLVARASLVPKVKETTIFPDTAFRLRLDPERVLPAWFVAVWNAPSTRAKYEKRVRTTAGIWKVSLRDIAAVRIEVPSLDEQRAAVEIIQAATARLDRALAKEERSNRLLDRFEQCIYSMAFDGRLVDQVPAEGDASALLAEIRSRPVPKRVRKPKGMLMLTNRDRFHDLAAAWPESGHSFEELKRLLPAPYEELKNIVFDEIQRGTLRQQFDGERRSIVLVRVG